VIEWDSEFARYMVLIRAVVDKASCIIYNRLSSVMIKRIDMAWQVMVLINMQQSWSTATARLTSPSHREPRQAI
jgi:hypothetical protein